MPTLDDVYREFGDASEAVQILETELGNMLFAHGIISADLLDNPDVGQARDLIDTINRKTMGQLLHSLHRSDESVSDLEGVLKRALEHRNRLTHGFFRRHNFRRNTDEGRTLMMQDLDLIHTAVLDAYKALMLLSGVDLDKMTMTALPTKYVPI